MMRIVKVFLLQSSRLVADLLSKAEKTLKYWNKVAEKQNSVFMDANHEMSKPQSGRLEFLLTENTDLVHWRVGLGSFPKLTHLNIKHGCKLEEIPREFGKTLSQIEQPFGCDLCKANERGSMEQRKLSP
ncbi:hypothetical protein Pfo_005727 [Paulownia fortunei]|nr:hypothetical protein Pfo_005727 [Paulownia fortunei]